MTPQTAGVGHPGETPAPMPGLDPGLARSAGLGSVGPAAAHQNAPDMAPSEGRRPTAPGLVTPRRLVGAGVCAAVAVAVVVAGLSFTSHSQRTGGRPSAASSGNARLAAAALASSRSKYATAVATYEQDMGNISTTTALAVTGNASMSSAMDAWNQFTTDVQGLSAAAQSIPASSAAASDAHALVGANSGLASALAQFEQDPTSQSAVTSLRTALVSSAQAAAQVERDLGIPDPQLQASGGQ